MNASFRSSSLCLLNSGVPSVPPISSSCRTGDQSQRFTYARQALYHLGSISSPTKDTDLYQEQEDSAKCLSSSSPQHLHPDLHTPTPPPPTTLPTFSQAVTEVPRKRWTHRLPACLSQWMEHPQLPTAVASSGLRRGGEKEGEKGTQY